MCVYVDEANKLYGRMIMCHMIADSLEELHNMADSIGVKRKWFQDKIGHPHYDISKGKRQLAINLGAIEISGKELVKILKDKYGEK